MILFIIQSLFLERIISQSIKATKTKKLAVKKTQGGLREKFDEEGNPLN